MTNQEILEKSIQKVIDNGYDVGFDVTKIEVTDISSRPPEGIKYRINLVPRYQVTFEELKKNPYKYQMMSFDHERLLFSHSFAKALWGDIKVSPICKCGSSVNTPHSALAGGGIHGRVYENRGWKYHLQQMVIAEDQIKYLGENI